MICFGLWNRKLQRSMGEAGEIEPETESFLIENDIDSGDFSPDVLECLPQKTPWTIPQVCTHHFTLCQCVIHTQWECVYTYYVHMYSMAVFVLL